MEKLSLRLQTIFSMVEKDSVVADVGSDHGKLMISLYEKGIISLGYAIENKKGPFSRLEKALRENGCLENIHPLFSDGIRDLPDSVNTVVIAGMGGRTILDILSAHLEKLSHVDTIIIDGHSCNPLLREEISKMGYKIDNEQILKDEGIFYEIIKFKKGEQGIYSPEDIEFGPILRKEKSPIFIEKYQNRINEINNILLKDNIPQNAVDKYNLEKEKFMKVI